MAYRLKVYDNFNYMDEEEAYYHGHYQTYESALTAAKGIVGSFIRENYKSGMKPNDLTSQYTLYGEDPIIVSDTHPLPPDRFSAWEYAKAFVQSYCERKANG